MIYARVCVSDCTVETTRLVGSETAVIASGVLAYGSERQFERRSQEGNGSLPMRCKARHYSSIVNRQQKTHRYSVCFVMVETTRLELVTSTMSTWRSNQLGYASITLISYTNLSILTSVFRHFDKIRNLSFYCQELQKGRAYDKIRLWLRYLTY